MDKPEKMIIPLLQIASGLDNAPRTSETQFLGAMDDIAQFSEKREEYLYLKITDRLARQMADSLRAHARAMHGGE